MFVVLEPESLTKATEPTFLINSARTLEIDGAVKEPPPLVKSAGELACAIVGSCTEDEGTGAALVLGPRTAVCFGLPTSMGGAFLVQERM